MGHAPPRMLTLGCEAPQGPPHPDCNRVTIPAVSPHHLQDEGPLVAVERQKSIHLAKPGRQQGPSCPPQTTHSAHKQTLWRVCFRLF